MTDLKPCPFCGGTNIDPNEVMAQRTDGSRYSYPGCGDCGASAPLWNNRIQIKHEPIDPDGCMHGIPWDQNCGWCFQPRTVESGLCDHEWEMVGPKFKFLQTNICSKCGVAAESEQQT